MSTAKKGGNVRVSLASKRRQAAAAADVMTRGWSHDWVNDPIARDVHGTLITAMDEEAPQLVGKGLNKWKGGALNAVRLAKQSTAIDIRQAVGSPLKRFGVAPVIPVAPPQTQAERESAAAIRSAADIQRQRYTTGVGANSRGDTGTPYNIDSFRRPRVTERRGGAVMSSGVPIEDTLPGRNMKSCLDLEALTPIQETCDIMFNVGGSDGPAEDWVNPGLRHGHGGMKLFSSRGPRL
jgi:hypothetical protein